MTRPVPAAEAGGAAVHRAVTEVLCCMYAPAALAALPLLLLLLLILAHGGSRREQLPPVSSSSDSKRRHGSLLDILSGATARPKGTVGSTSGGRISSGGELGGNGLSHADLFERAYYINAAGSTRRRAFMEEQLHASGVRFERWEATRGGPSLLRTHASYFERGVHAHLYANRTRGGELVGWGTLSTYLSHHTLFEHIIRTHRRNDSAAFLVLQDDTLLAASGPRL